MRARAREVVAVVAVLPIFVSSVADAREAVVRSFDGTPIVTQFFPAEGLPPGQRAPTVLWGHGFGGQGVRRPDADRPPPRADFTADYEPRVSGVILRNGANVLTWDARGFGESGGNVSLDDPEIEGRDVQALIDYVARQPESQLDAPGDPRLGMAGASYGGGIQLTAASIDRRIDVIVPVATWSSLTTSLVRNGVVKSGWGVLLFAGGLTSIPGGLASPAGPQTGAYDPPIFSALTTALATGRLTDEQVRYFARKGPAGRLHRVRVPTLLIQGTVDTLFTLDEAIRNYRAIKSNGVPVKMLWFCGGHGICFGKGATTEPLERAGIAWMKRYLMRDRSVDTGPPFQWVTDTDGRVRSAPIFPPVRAAPLVGTGAGLLPVSPGSIVQLGAPAAPLVAAGPVAGAVNVDVPPPPRPVDVLGEPRVRIAYRGVASPPGTHLFAQVVDVEAGRVLGNIATPVPVTLDGAQRTVELPLEAVASHGHRYRLQVTDGTSLYYPQRSTGAVELSRVRIELPVIDPSKSPGLALGRPSGLRQATRRRPARVFVRGVYGPIRSVTVVLERRGRRGRPVRWARVGRSRRFDVGERRRRVAIRLRGRLPTGLYRARAAGRDQEGRRVTVERRARLTRSRS